jgi:hypothetical protein
MLPEGVGPIEPEDIPFDKMGTLAEEAVWDLAVTNGS